MLGVVDGSEIDPQPPQTKAMLYLRRDARLQVDSLSERLKLFRESVTAIHHVVRCRAQRILNSNKYPSRSSVHTVTAAVCNDIKVDVDFRIRDGDVVVESYNLRRV
jgi:hypothetical protein